MHAEAMRKNADICLALAEDHKANQPARLRYMRMAAARQDLAENQDWLAGAVRERRPGCRSRWKRHSASRRWRTLWVVTQAGHLPQTDIPPAVPAGPDKALRTPRPHSQRALSSAFSASWSNVRISSARLASTMLGSR
jgi:hypothetical protein